MNLASWICCMSALPQAILNIQSYQSEILTSQHYDIYTSTADNLINDMHPFSFAMGYIENEVFHLGQMLRQPDKASFGEAME